MSLEATADLKVDGETLNDALRRVNADVSKLPRLTSFPQGKIVYCWLPVITDAGQTFQNSLLEVKSQNQWELKVLFPHYVVFVSSRSSMFGRVQWRGLLQGQDNQVCQFDAC